MPDDSLDLEILPLTPSRLEDVRALFDEGGDAKSCQCAFWRVPGRSWSEWTKARNRTVLEELAGQEPAPGLVAYADGRAIGWVSLGPRVDFARLVRSRVLAPVDERPVWSVVCFVVSKRWRGRGVASALLEAALDYARDHGATLVEAYPVDPSRGRVPAAAAYMGALSMYEAAGFEVVARRQWNASSPVRPVVRRAIRRRRSSRG